LLLAQGFSRAKIEEEGVVTVVGIPNESKGEKAG
jgi:hypothetical protein